MDNNENKHYQLGLPKSSIDKFKKQTKMLRVRELDYMLFEVLMTEYSQIQKKPMTRKDCFELLVKNAVNDLMQSKNKADKE